jgi:trans-aconitate 2-methyltransferase
MADWDPELYNRFRRYRAEPVEMIFARLALGSRARIIDLGCGSGENTIGLARRAQDGLVTGIDSSRAMIDRAMKLRDELDATLKRRVDFVLDDFRNFSADRDYTVVFSNAALQWVSDHRSVFASCYRALRASGRLVVQVPANEEESAQATIRRMASESPWYAVLGMINIPSRQTVGRPEGYRAMLAEIGFVDVDCYYHTFHHPMRNASEVVEFCRATALRPFMEKLPQEQHGTFIAELTSRLEDSYKTRGPVVFNFRRMFIWARRPDG